MLRKLLKHEFRATGRIMLPLFGILLLVSVGANFSSRGMLNSDSSLLRTLGTIFIMLFIVGIFAVGIISFVLMINRFYKNLLQDEGYVMMTLPVCVHQQIWSKLIVSAVWFIAAGIAVVAASFILVAQQGFWQEILWGFRQIFQGLTAYYAFNGTAFLLELLGLVFVSCCVLCLAFYAAMAIGHSFANHKGLLSVVFYFVIQAVLQIFGVAVLSGVVSDTAFHRLLTDAMDNLGRTDTAAAAMQAAHGTMLLALFTELFLGAILYFLTYFMLRKHRNLQ